MERIKEASVNLAKALVSKESSRKAVADKLSISVSYLSLLENGYRIVSINLCKKIKMIYPDLEALCLAIQIKKVDL